VWDLASAELMPARALEEVRLVNITVIVASVGRPDALRQLWMQLDRSMTQLGIQMSVIVSVPAHSDLPAESTSWQWRNVVGTRGASAQRNRALDAVSADTDFVFFFDDDALPRDDYISNAVLFFGKHPSAIAITGNVLADGAALSREISVEEAKALLYTSCEAPVKERDSDRAHDELYGCNFAVRWQACSDLRFDERLPLYSWLEDLDYAIQARRRGEIYWLVGSVVVHRGSNSGGRLQHRRFGYSQVANPLWLREKGSFSLGMTIKLILPPVAKNLALSLRVGERGALRRTRLQGNVRALRDVLRNAGKATPEAIVDMAD
jgi:GT2 family glycosyltransferase